LIARFQAGDSAAFDPLYKRHVVPIYDYLSRSLRDRHEAEDLTQQVFLRVWQGLPGYECLGQRFRAWLFKIARNALIDHSRRRARMVPTAPEELDRRREGEDLSASALALDELFIAEVLTMVRALPLPQRQVLAMRDLFDCPYSDIAVAVGRSEAAVRQLHCRALRNIKPRVTAYTR
jgi:RNA polymerase sigma-70 factor, ECF subfamily